MPHTRKILLEIARLTVPFPGKHVETYNLEVVVKFRNYQHFYMIKKGHAESAILTNCVKQEFPDCYVYYRKILYFTTCEISEDDTFLKVERVSKDYDGLVFDITSEY